MAQDNTWAARAGHAKSPGETGPIAEMNDGAAHDTRHPDRGHIRASLRSAWQARVDAGDDLLGQQMPRDWRGREQERGGWRSADRHLAENGLPALCAAWYYLDTGLRSGGDSAS